MCNDELIALRRRVTNQRRELRRLNRTVSLMWKGWNYHGYISSQNRYRALMVDTFGMDAVMQAEGQSPARTLS